MLFLYTLFYIPELLYMPLFTFSGVIKDAPMSQFLALKGILFCDLQPPAIVSWISPIKSISLTML